MNSNELHSTIQLENQILMLQIKLLKIEDEKQRDDIKMQIIALNAKVKDKYARLK